jgi:hypothetical protein
MVRPTSVEGRNSDLNLIASDSANKQTDYSVKQKFVSRYVVFDNQEGVMS